jgi:hypothetical protein
MAIRPIDISGLHSALGQLGQSRSLLMQRQLDFEARRQAEFDRRRAERAAKKEEERRKNADFMGNIGTVGGAVAGGAAGFFGSGGNPAGAIAGASAGADIGNQLFRTQAGDPIDVPQLTQTGLRTAQVAHNISQANDDKAQKKSENQALLSLAGQTPSTQVSTQAPATASTQRQLATSPAGSQIQADPGGETVTTQTSQPNKLQKALSGLDLEKTDPSFIANLIKTDQNRIKEERTLTRQSAEDARRAAQELRSIAKHNADLEKNQLETAMNGHVNNETITAWKSKVSKGVEQGYITPKKQKEYETIIVDAEKNLTKADKGVLSGHLNRTSLKELNSKPVLFVDQQENETLMPVDIAMQKLARGEGAVKDIQTQQEIQERQWKIEKRAQEVEDRQVKERAIELVGQGSSAVNQKESCLTQSRGV